MGWNKDDEELNYLRGSARWKKLREAILSARPLCVTCQRMGIPRPAEEIHHVIPARRMIALYGDEGFYKIENLVPLCVRCHQRNEHALENGTAGVVFGEEYGAWAEKAAGGDPH